MTLAEGTVIGSQWRIGSLVGEGACGRVYAVTNTKPKNVYSIPLVAKVIPTAQGTSKAAKEQRTLCDTLHYEYQLFHGQLGEFEFRPDIPDLRNFYGVDEQYQVRFLIMERFERDLVAYASAGKPDNRAVAMIGLQILSGLEWMHNKGMLFIDVKPDNFMLNGEKVKFVDYGLVERWATATGSRIEAVRAMAGTPSYASLDVHNCRTPMRKDDIESLGLVLISLFLEGKLPWFDARSDEDCKERKFKCDISVLSSENNCPEVGEIIKLCRALKFAQKPDYNAYKELLEQMRDRKVPSKGFGGLKSCEVSLKRDLSSVAKASSGSSSSNSSKSSALVEVIKVEEKAAIKESKAKAPAVKGLSIVKKPSAGAEVDEVKLLGTLRIDDKNIREKENEQFTPTKEPVRKSSRLAVMSSPIPINYVPAFVAPTSSGRQNKQVEKLEPKTKRTVKGTKKRLFVEKIFYIEVTSGPAQGLIFHIDKSPDSQDEILQQRIVGRDGSPTADIKLGNDSMMSERHLCLLWCWSPLNDLQLDIQDKSSTNGVYLNGTKIVNQTWNRAYHGNTIKIGETVLRIHCE